MSPQSRTARRLAVLSLAAAFLAGCATTPPAPDLTPPRRPYDAKTQLEYGSPPPPPPPARY